MSCTLEYLQFQYCIWMLHEIMKHVHLVQIALIRFLFNSLSFSAKIRWNRCYWTPVSTSTEPIGGHKHHRDLMCELLNIFFWLIVKPSKTHLFIYGKGVEEMTEWWSLCSVRKKRVYLCESVNWKSCPHVLSGGHGDLLPWCGMAGDECCHSNHDVV